MNQTADISDETDEEPGGALGSCGSFFYSQMKRRLE
jgi:hypothetical protein